MNKIDTLEPEFKEKVQLLLTNINNVTGRKWVVVSGRRTMKEQAALYAQGRTTAGKVVTKAPAGSSAHNFGLAADLAPLKLDDSDVDWNAPRSLWQAMADMAVGIGLTAGFYFTTIFDAPHVESKDWKQQQALWKAGKLEVV